MNASYDEKRRSYLMKCFNEMNLGYLEEIYKLSTDKLEAMVFELGNAQDAGELDLETNAGVDNLERIVSKYI